MTSWLGRLARVLDVEKLKYAQSARTRRLSEDETSRAAMSLRRFAADVYTYESPDCSAMDNASRLALADY